MVGEINFGILDTEMPAKIAGSFRAGRQNAMAEALAGQEQRVNALKLQQAEQSMADEAATRGAFARSGGDLTAAREQLLGAGQYKPAMEIDKQLAAQRKDRLSMAMYQTKLMKTYATRVFADPRPETALAALQELGAATGVDMSADIAKVQQMTPDQVRIWAAGHAVEADKLMTKFSTMDLNGEIQPIGQDPLTGAITLTARAIPKTLGPGQAEELALSRGRLAAQIDANQAVRDAAGMKRQTDVEMKLADDYRTESKGFAETASAMRKVLSAIPTATTNPGSALAAGTAFMKILDPNSVVRESELGMALNASGWFDRAANLVNTMKSGKVMTPAQAQNLKAAADTLWGEVTEAQRGVDASYQQRANAYGVDPGNIIINRGQQAPPANDGWSIVEEP